MIVEYYNRNPATQEFLACLVFGSNGNVRVRVTRGGDALRLDAFLFIYIMLLSP